MLSVPRSAVALTAAVAALATGCASVDPETGERTVNRTATGAILGGLLGAGAGLAAGGDDKKNVLAGAAAGAAVGAVAGNVLDRQARRLAEQAEGTGVEVTREADGVRVVLPADVAFNVGSADIQTDLRATLDRFAETLQQEPATRITVIGHTDSTGSNAVNDALSTRRAKAVADYLVARGVSDGRMSALGVGSTQPVASNDTESGRAKNRRVEFTLS